AAGVVKTTALEPKRPKEPYERKQPLVRAHLGGVPELTLDLLSDKSKMLVRQLVDEYKAIQPAGKALSDFLIYVDVGVMFSKKWNGLKTESDSGHQDKILSAASVEQIIRGLKDEQVPADSKTAQKLIKDHFALPKPIQIDMGRSGLQTITPPPIGIEDVIAAV